MAKKASAKQVSSPKSGKQHGYSTSSPKDHAQRKREERAVRRLRNLQQSSYFCQDENYPSFKEQLLKLGLHLREISGDGNCLFRALGDQLDGHVKNHLAHRANVVAHMRDHRNDFEPFLDEDEPFDRLVAQLAQPGYFGGNESIVAFARLHGVIVMIHQLNQPAFIVHGSDNENAPQVHIAYHNGDHYSSVRKLSDFSQHPANVKIKLDDLKSQEDVKPPSTSSTEKKSQNSQDGANHASMAETEQSWISDDAIQKLRVLSGIEDTVLIAETLLECDGDEELAMSQLLHIAEISSGDSACESLGHDQTEPPPPQQQTNATATSYAEQQSKFQNRKSLSRQRKLEKKRRHMERKRAKILGQENQTTHSTSQTLAAEEDVIELPPRLAALRI